MSYAPSCFHLLQFSTIKSCNIGHDQDEPDASIIIPILHRFDTLQQCDRRVTKFTEESFVLTIVTQLPPTGTILSRSQLLKEEIATRFKNYLSSSLQFIYLLIVSVPVILWINKPTSLLMNHNYPDTTNRVSSDNTQYNILYIIDFFTMDCSLYKANLKPDTREKLRLIEIIITQ